MTKTMTSDFEILAINKDFLIVWKNAGIPCAPLVQGEEKCLLYEVSKIYPDILTVDNQLKEIEKGLIHRIDTATEGCVLFARNTQFWNHIFHSQKNGEFTKFYTAFCDKIPGNAEKLGSFPQSPALIFSLFPNEIQSKFRNFGPGKKEVRPVIQQEKARYVDKKVFDKIYKTKICSINAFSHFYEVECAIQAGFRHQVRCHLAWVGFSVINDSIYNFRCRSNEMPRDPLTYDSPRDPVLGETPHDLAKCDKAEAPRDSLTCDSSHDLVLGEMPRDSLTCDSSHDLVLGEMPRAPLTYDSPRDSALGEAPRDLAKCDKAEAPRDPALSEISRAPVQSAQMQFFATGFSFPTLQGEILTFDFSDKVKRPTN